jgi:Zn-finger nucleic acid-binding protein
MLIVEFEEIELDACPDCRGIWFDSQELGELFELIGAPDHLHDLENQLQRLAHAKARRFCPRCRSRVEPVRAPARDGELILDECPRGHGLWFDRGELEALLECLLGEESSALEDVRRYLGQFATPRDAGDLTD